LTILNGKSYKIDMSGIRFISALRRVLFGMIVFALAFAPLQSFSLASATTTMVMVKADCPQTQKKDCCDKEKSDCMMKQSCMTSYNSSLGTLNVAELKAMGIQTEKLAMADAAFLEPHASPPLRRPPRI
jgi:hypothetical protein